MIPILWLINNILLLGKSRTSAAAKERNVNHLIHLS